MFDKSSCVIVLNLNTNLISIKVEVSHIRPHSDKIVACGMITDDIEAFAWILDNKLTKLYSVLTLSLRIVSSQSMNRG